MRLIQQLLEMAKSNTKRESQAKRRRKKKANTPTQDALSNPVAAAVSELHGAGQGVHPTAKDKDRDPRTSRRKNKVSFKDYS